MATLFGNARIAQRDLPPYFLHPRYHDQLDDRQVESLQLTYIEEYPGRCRGHLGTKVHLQSLGDGKSQYLVEVSLDTGKVHLEVPCTYLPAMGMDLVDGNLVLDAEEWVLVQKLGLKPRRLKYIFKNDDRRSCEEYVRLITAPHAGELFQDVEPEFEQDLSMGNRGCQPKTSSEKPWWKFWGRKT